MSKVLRQAFSRAAVTFSEKDENEKRALDVGTNSLKVQRALEQWFQSFTSFNKATTHLMLEMTSLYPPAGPITPTLVALAEAPAPLSDSSMNQRIDFLRMTLQQPLIAVGKLVQDLHDNIAKREVLQRERDHYVEKVGKLRNDASSGKGKDAAKSKLTENEDKLKTVMSDYAEAAQVVEKQLASLEADVTAILTPTTMQMVKNIISFHNDAAAAVQKAIDASQLSSNSQVFGADAYKAVAGRRSFQATGTAYDISAPQFVSKSGPSESTLQPRASGQPTQPIAPTGIAAAMKASARDTNSSGAPEPAHDSFASFTAGATKGNAAQQDPFDLRESSTTAPPAPLQHKPSSNSSRSTNPFDEDEPPKAQPKANTAAPPPPPRTESSPEAQEKSSAPAYAGGIAAAAAATAASKAAGSGASRPSPAPVQAQAAAAPVHRRDVSELNAARPALKLAKGDADFPGESEGDLKFGEGEVLAVVKEDDSGWWDARCGKDFGAIPSNYVVLLPAETSFARDPSLPHTKYVATRDYTPSDTTELAFNEGQELEVLIGNESATDPTTKRARSSGFALAQLGDAIGFVPLSALKLPGATSAQASTSRQALPSRPAAGGAGSNRALSSSAAPGPAPAERRGSGGPSAAAPAPSPFGAGAPGPGGAPPRGALLAGISGFDKHKLRPSTADSDMVTPASNRASVGPSPFGGAGARGSAAAAPKPMSMMEEMRMKQRNRN